MLQQHSTHWHFSEDAPSHASLDPHLSQAHLAAPADTTAGWTIVLSAFLNPTTAPCDLLCIPGVLRVCTRMHDPRERDRQNYPAYPMPDGSVPVLEAIVTLYAPSFPAGKEMIIGVPLARLQQTTGPHEVTVHFSGVHWSLYVDGILYDTDFPLGYPQWPAAPSWQRDAHQTTHAQLWIPALTPQPAADPVLSATPLQYWTPPGHNTWVGDVVTIMHAGRYHLFYLSDRRHHQSKFGMGAHYFEHLSTTDFRTWTMHDAATPLEAQWECIGTGTPFVDNDGRLCLAYALHTERVCADSDTTLPAQLAWLAHHGETGRFDRSTPGLPIGSTYAVSADGVADFHKSGIFMHPCRNPSIYRDHTGALRMLANYAGAADAAWGKGTWASAHVDGGWHCLDADFPPGGDCTFAFRWGTYDYVIGGFVNLWSKAVDAPDATYQDLVSRGMDCYDGLNVPAISEVSPGRFLMAGWCAIRGWGGALVIRDLIQFPDGGLGSRWMPELIPDCGHRQFLGTMDGDQRTIPAPAAAFLWECTIHPKQNTTGIVRVLFVPAAEAENACEWQIDLGAGRAQFAPGSAHTHATRQRSLREGGNPAHAADYAIEHDWSNAEPMTIRILVKTDNKLGGALIDVEIAGQRTMLSFRPDLAVNALTVSCTGVSITEERIAPIEQGLSQ